MRTIRSNQTIHRRSGASLLETTIVLTLLLMIVIFPSIEFAYFFYLKHSLQGAAREGARAAIVPSAANSDVNSAIATAMSTAGLTNSGYTVAIRNSADSANVDVATAASGTAILVKVTCTWQNAGIGRLGIYQLIPTSKQIIGKTVMRKEG
jgi:Flp pilus assembly protein TadG